MNVRRYEHWPVILLTVAGLIFGGGEIVPIGVSTNKRVLLRPESLERILEVGETEFINDGSSVEIGYFCKQIYSAESHGSTGAIFENMAWRAHINLGKRL